MSVRCGEVIKMIESLAPTHLAEEWDHVGLHLGNKDQEVKRVLIALDGSEEVINESINVQADLIITHHPFLFKPMKTICSNDYMGSLVIKLIKQDTSVYCAHTNLDTAKGGVNDYLAKKLGIQNVEALATSHIEKLYKIVVFVPQTHTDVVRNAMGAAGAGYIGGYSHCTFKTSGEGTFLPQEGCNPFLGQVGNLEKVEEDRLETIVPQSKLSSVLKEMEQAHPYEEVAYDLYALENKGETEGLGRIGQLAEERSLEDFLHQVEDGLSIKGLNYVGNLNKKVKTVAVCGGSGAGFMAKAISKGADVYVTGDLKYHEAQMAHQNDLAVIDAGHFGTEHPIVEYLVEYLQEAFPSIEIMASKQEHNVLKRF